MMELWNLIHDRVRHQESIFPVPPSFSPSYVTIPARGYATVPMGWYFILGGPSIYLEMHDGTAWRRSSSTFSGTLKSDGTNVRLYNSSSSASWYLLVPL